MKRLQILALIASLILTACSTYQQIRPVEAGVAKTLADHRKENITDLVYQLQFDIPEGKEEAITGKNKMIFNLKSTKQDLQIDFREDGQLIKSVKCNGNESAFRFESEHVVVPKSELIVGQNEVEIEFVAGNTSLNRNDEFLYTLFVPDRARTAFPCFDQPNLKASFQLNLSVPSHWKAMANGKLDSKKDEGDRSFYSFIKTKALPTYLFSFVAGKFETVTREHNGRKHTMYHRVTDPKKLANNTDEIFRLLFESLDWLEEYTDVPYPFEKYDIVTIPSFQYGGMEHTGATLYNSTKLFLDKNAPKGKRLYRANLIAHETAHMWFGDLVTMKWFDQVWLKEVFANFLADKITNPSFPETNHKLKFQMAHVPSSFSVDRTSGANPINQVLPNLKDAGSVYGAIIYHKSPIVMNMLENITGKEALKKGLQTYMKNYAYGNASWEDLISILDATTATDLKTWSKVWVNKAGRPHIAVEVNNEAGKIKQLNISQTDVNGKPGNWTQDLNLLMGYESDSQYIKVNMNAPSLNVDKAVGLDTPDYIIPNAKGDAYGFFKLDEKSKAYLLENMDAIQDDLVRGIAWVNLYENLREGQINGKNFVLAINKQLPIEENSLILELMLSYLKSSYWLDLNIEERNQLTKKIEDSLWTRLNSEKDMSKKSSFYTAFASIAQSPDRLEQLYKAWDRETTIGGFRLSETKTISLACNLAIKMPEKAKELISIQSVRIIHPPSRKKMKFMAPSISADPQVRKDFFESLKKEENRQIERWALEALRYLNHPLREKEALIYLPQTLELLKEIQTTGDIFLPYNWLITSYSGLQSKEAGDITRKFLQERPDYPENLKLKILQAADVVLKK